jgi:hypothetical protein
MWLLSVFILRFPSLWREAKIPLCASGTQTRKQIVVLCCFVVWKYCLSGKTIVFVTLCVVLCCLLCYYCRVFLLFLTLSIWFEGLIVFCMLILCLSGFLLCHSFEHFTICFKLWFDYLYLFIWYFISTNYFSYRLEKTLNYGFERVWSLGFLKGSNMVAFGYDDGTVVIKIGSENPCIR